MQDGGLIAEMRWINDYFKLLSSPPQNAYEGWTANLIMLFADAVFNIFTGVFDVPNCI